VSQLLSFNSSVMSLSEEIDPELSWEAYVGDVFDPSLVLESTKWSSESMEENVEIASRGLCRCRFSF